VGSLRQLIKDFLFGMVLYEHAMIPVKEKAELERLLLMVLFGDVLGIPLWQPYHSLRILPFVCTRIDTWKHSMLRGRDWTDGIFD